MNKVKPLQSIILLIAIILSSELAIMYVIDSNQFRTMLSPEAINTVDAVLLTLIAAGAAIWLLVLPLRKSLRRNSQLALAISHTSMGYLSYDPYLSGGEFVFANEAFTSQTGFELKDIKGEASIGFFDEDIQEEIARAIKREDKLSLEVLLTCKDGSTFRAEVKLIPIFEENGLLNQYIFLIHDASDKRQSGINSRKMLRAIEQSSEAVIITDIQGVIEYVNPAFEKNTGYTAKDAIGNTPAILSSGRQDKEWYRSLWTHILQGKTWSGYHINRRKDGSEYEEFMTISPIRDDGGHITHFVSVQRDISEQRVLEKQLIRAQKLEAVGALAGGIAHDFNNALAGILGHTYLLKKDIDNKKSLERIEVIELLGLKSAKIIKQLLSFSRQQESDKKDILLIPFIKETSKLIEATIPGNIAFSIDLTKANDLAVNMDVIQVQQVITNMVNNARDAMNEQDQGSIHLTVAKMHHNDVQESVLSNLNVFSNDEACVISIQDNGHGIPKENVEKIFDPFFSTKALDEGTGLGLAMSYGIINQHHGYIHVDSTVGKGTRFDIYLPAVSKNEITTEIDLSTITLNGLGRTVMVVDDNATVRLSIVEILEGLNFTVIQACDGYQAIDMYKKHQENLDLILMDIVMPNLGGIAAAKSIRETNGSIPIIYLTAHDPNNSMAEISWMPKVDLIAKPFDPLVLNRKISQLI